MARKMLINVSHAEEARVAIVEDGILDNFDIESSGKERIKGNIYKGIVSKVAPALQAAFVEYGEGRNGFLPLKEVCYKFVDKPQDGKDRKPVRRPTISDLLRAKQEIIVQVVKEETGNKGATLSTFFSLPGRFLVLMPGSDTAGVSRRIEDEGDRKKLKEIIADLKPPEGFGLIARTAGFNAKKPDLLRDFNYLMRLWDDICKASEQVPQKSLIYHERDIAIRAIRDYFTSDINEVLIDDAEVHRRAKGFMRLHMPSKQRIIKLHSDVRPLFNKYQLEEQIERIYKRTVPLKSGGAIVIDPTEAFVTVDVNSGRNVSEANLEDTAYRTNLEAADELSRQLRLRDLGGLIVVDFIDMQKKAHIRDLEKQLSQALKKDRARTEMSRMGKFGLITLSRQRLGPRIGSAVYRTCPSCHGEGIIRSVESRVVMVLRKIQAAIAGKDVVGLTVSLPEETLLHLINNKRDVLAAMEKRTGASIKFDTTDSPEQVEGVIDVLRAPQQPDMTDEPPAAPEPPAEKGQQVSPGQETDLKPPRRRKRPPRRGKRRRAHSREAENGGALKKPAAAGQDPGPAGTGEEPQDLEPSPGVLDAPLGESAPPKAPPEN